MAWMIVKVNPEKDNEGSFYRVINKDQALNILIPRFNFREKLERFLDRGQIAVVIRLLNKKYPVKFVGPSLRELSVYEAVRFLEDRGYRVTAKQNEAIETVIRIVEKEGYIVEGAGYKTKSAVSVPDHRSGLISILRG